MKKTQTSLAVLVMLLIWLTAACKPAGSQIEMGSQTNTPSFINGVVSTYSGLDGRTIYFPKQGPTNAYMEALIWGRLMLDSNGCLRVAGEGTDHPRLILWHHDFTLRMAGQEIEVLNGSGQVVGRSGQEIVMGGGEIPEMALRVPPIEACPGPYFQMGAIDALDEQEIQR